MIIWPERGAPGRLILSLFPGLGLLDAAFEEAGACVVRGPDPIWGGDVREFEPPRGRFDGVIGGPPCKAFSTAQRINRAMGREPRVPNLIPEFERVVSEAAPTWFLMENVPLAPEPVVEGYATSSALLNNRWLGAAQNRLRRFTLGVRGDECPPLQFAFAALECAEWEHAVTCGHGLANGKSANRRRTWREAARLQGETEERIARLEKFGSLKAASLLEGYANAVPRAMGRACVGAVLHALTQTR